MAAQCGRDRQVVTQAVNKVNSLRKSDGYAAKSELCLSEFGIYYTWYLQKILLESAKMTKTNKNNV